MRALLASLEPGADIAALTAACDAEDQLAAYFADLLAVKRARPTDDLLSRLAVANGDDILDDDECVGTAILLFAAGFETTTNLIGNGVAALLAHPDQMRELRARPELASNAVEELLRYESPVQTNGRTVLQPTRLAGVDLHPGQVVLILLGGSQQRPGSVRRPRQSRHHPNRGPAIVVRGRHPFLPRRTACTARRGNIVPAPGVPISRSSAGRAAPLAHRAVFSRTFDLEGGHRISRWFIGQS
ncbi:MULTISPECIES: cytochrome P450 family protein [Nocardia]|uniref:cytochrome P450 n=1 Tax=Nocardia TaxID=1817 RepID=UPI0008E23210|nr:MULTISPECIES: cytochrome P450 [Nocardia]UGT50801.1 cytochrome P450 [Nocardia asteroides]SFN84410.1 Cytochrome P450 [Nocardia asteroides]VEG36357.1 Biotin biosynthesis cytochrome P450 [Nocardia asteroides]